VVEPAVRIEPLLRGLFSQTRDPTRARVVRGESEKSGVDGLDPGIVVEVVDDPREGIGEINLLQTLRGDGEGGSGDVPLTCEESRDELMGYSFVNEPSTARLGMLDSRRSSLLLDFGRMSHCPSETEPMGLKSN
jgi:hypothetical protein